MNVVEAEKSFATLVDRVHREGICVDLERDDEVIARLTPATPGRGLKAGNLVSFLRSLPSLGSDAESFAADLRAIRSNLPQEDDPWE